MEYRLKWQKLFPALIGLCVLAAFVLGPQEVLANTARSSSTPGNGDYALLANSYQNVNSSLYLSKPSGNNIFRRATTITLMILLSLLALASGQSTVFNYYFFKHGLAKRLQPNCLLVDMPPPAI